MRVSQAKDYSQIEERLLSNKEAARVLFVHPNTIKRWADAGRLPYFTIGERKDRRYRAVDVKALLVPAQKKPR